MPTATSFSDSLSPAAREALAGLSERLAAALPAAPPAPASFAATLSPGARQALGPAMQDLAMDEEPAAEPRYCLVEILDGEFPMVRLFDNAESLARYLGRQEGTGRCLVPFFGIPLPFGTPPRRYLRLPDGELLTIPLKGEPPKRLEASLVGFQPQQDWYVGNEAVASGSFLDDLDEQAAPATAADAARES